MLFAQVLSTALYCGVGHTPEVCPVQTERAGAEQRGALCLMLLPFQLLDPVGGKHSARTQAVAQSLPVMREVLGSSPSTAKKKKKKTVIFLGNDLVNTTLLRYNSYTVHFVCGKCKIQECLCRECAPAFDFRTFTEFKKESSYLTPLHPTGLSSH